MSSHPLIVRSRTDVVAAVLIRDGRMLLTQRRRGKAFEYSWSSPGGKVDEGEAHSDALVRELREEVGASIVLPIEERLWSLWIEPPVVAGPLAVTTYRVLLSPCSREPAPLEGQGLGWFGPDELAVLPLTPADAVRRAELINLLRRSA